MCKYKYFISLHYFSCCALLLFLVYLGGVLIAPGFMGVLVGLHISDTCFLRGFNILGVLL